MMQKGKGLDKDTNFLKTVIYISHQYALGRFGEKSKLLHPLDWNDDENEMFAEHGDLDSNR